MSCARSERNATPFRSGNLSAGGAGGSAFKLQKPPQMRVPRPSRTLRRAGTTTASTTGGVEQTRVAPPAGEPPFQLKAWVSRRALCLHLRVPHLSRFSKGGTRPEARPRLARRRACFRDDGKPKTLSEDRSVASHLSKTAKGGAPGEGARRGTCSSDPQPSRVFGVGRTASAA